MNTELKYVAVGIGIIALIAAMMYGSILPFVKAQRYIDALNRISTLHSLAEFEANFNTVFDFYSPVGDEEVAKFLGTNLVGFIGDPHQSESVSREMIRYIEPRMQKDNVRHLIMLGQMYLALWRNFHHQEDYATARDYYLHALSIGPNLPPLLYGLLDIYHAGGDIEHTKEIAGRILSIWPNDTSLAKSLQDLERAQK